MLSVCAQWGWPGVAFVSAVLLATVSLGSESSLADGTGGGLQVPVKPDYQVTRPGELGLCQCTRDTTALHASCQPNRVSCESLCGSSVYGYVPNASFSCPVPSEGAVGTTS